MLNFIIGVFLQVQSVALSASVNHHSFQLPVAGALISSGFGPRLHPVTQKNLFHSGVDLAAKKGSAVRSIGAGIIVFSKKYKGYGNLVVVLHSHGITTHYGHLAELSVDVGDRVGQGALLGTIGSTGLTTGPHLHFETRQSGAPFDPNLLFEAIRSSSW